MGPVRFDESLPAEPVGDAAAPAGAPAISPAGDDARVDARVDAAIAPDDPSATAFGPASADAEVDSLVHARADRPASPMNWRIVLWRGVALLALALAAIGVVLPGLPTVPFLLVAAWAAERGWPALERWLILHAHFGPILLRWRARRAIPRRAKWAATVAMLASSVVLIFTPSVPQAVRWLVPPIMLAVAVWMWRRPDE